MKTTIQRILEATADSPKKAHDDSLDRVLDGEGFMRVVTPDFRRELRRRGAERSKERA